MNLIEQVNAGVMAAMKAKDADRLRALRGIKSAFLLLQTGEGVTEVTDDMCIKALQKLAKQRKDSLEIFERQNRMDLAQKEKEELEVIERFLPKQLGEDEIKAVVAEIIQQSGVVNISGLGQVMGLATKQLAGKADGKVISSIVKELLA
jgi:uncharacterized protein YqeY